MSKEEMSRKLFVFVLLAVLAAVASGCVVDTKNCKPGNAEPCPATNAETGKIVTTPVPTPAPAPSPNDVVSKKGIEIVGAAVNSTKGSIVDKAVKAANGSPLLPCANGSHSDGNGNCVYK